MYALISLKVSPKYLLYQYITAKNIYTHILYICNMCVYMSVFKYNIHKKCTHHNCVVGRIITISSHITTTHTKN